MGWNGAYKSSCKLWEPTYNCFLGPTLLLARTLLVGKKTCFHPHCQITSWTSHSSCKSTPFFAIELREGLWNSWIISEWRRIFHLYSVQPSQYAVHVLQTHWSLWNGKIKPLSPITKKKIAENMLCIRRINISGRMKDVHLGGKTWNPKWWALEKIFSWRHFGYVQFLWGVNDG